MHMKEDHMKNGQLKAGYNVQIGVDSEYIVNMGIFSERSDQLTLSLIHICWSGYGNQVMWDKPANASGSTYLEYEAQLVLNGRVLQTESVEINRWVFFNNLTEPQEAYTLKVRARQIYLTGDPDGSYTVWKRDVYKRQS